MPPPSLAERLGYGPTDRVLIVTADDAGMSHAVNAAIAEGFAGGILQTAGAMVPTPWFDEIRAYALEHPEADIGVHLTLTSEMQGCRWRPLLGQSDVPGLTDDLGFFHARAQAVWAHATHDEIERECRAQVETALAAGIDVTHLDSHMGVLQFDTLFDPIYRSLAADYDLPLRMLSQEALARVDMEHVRAELDQAGVLYPDHFVVRENDSVGPARDYWQRVFDALPPGVTEVALHPACPSPEVDRMTRRTSPPFAAAARAEEHALLTDPQVREALAHAGIHLADYRVLRDLQRATRTV